MPPKEKGPRCGPAQACARRAPTRACGTRACGCRSRPCRRSGRTAAPNLEAGVELGGLHDLARGVALDGGLGVGDLAHQRGRQLDRDRLAVVEHHLDRHAVLEVLDRVAHVLGFDLELVVLGVHEGVHRVGEVGVRALLLVEDDLVHLVVGLEDDLGARVAEQALQLHAHGGRVAAAAAVLGLEDDHRVLALHDDVAGANFLGDFHDIWSIWEDARDESARRRLQRGAKPSILAFRATNSISPVVRSSGRPGASRHAAQCEAHADVAAASGADSGPLADPVPAPERATQRRRRTGPARRGTGRGKPRAWPHARRRPASTAARRTERRPRSRARASPRRARR